MTAELIARCRAGDADAFRELVEPFRRELLVHCYRFLGSMHDAEDALQETLLDAWRGLGGFEARSTVRTWLYRVATNRCLKLLRAASRRPRAAIPGSSAAASELPEPSARGEIGWLEPFPDVLLDGLADPVPGPEARYESKQAISLAFVTAVQLLPPRQRAVLILRDVLGYRAADVAEFLDATEESVTSALKRARAGIRAQPSGFRATQPPPPDSPGERQLVDGLARAFESGDVEGVVALLTDDVRLTMPPLPAEYLGREAVARLLAAVFHRITRYRLVATRSNGQPAFGVYVLDHRLVAWRATGLLVLTLAADRIAAVTRFENSHLPRFGLPRTLPLDR
ncbi:RNA polymerase subunit sigma-70 [Amycolatopsis benzoatilytica]|uniref:RNA polymerase subunit sigma-70 n=1 Tax=Amycolatopsis benzoatilytica TaxID=346045 RepID=UPI00037ADFF7|nr:RNA polymerase subunit sigma-70 [Amycolatopsis benzoatilytica]